MTEHNPDDPSAAGTESANAGKKFPLIHSRRRLLETLTAGGSLLLAGCGGSESTTPTATASGGPTPTTGTSTDDLSQVQGQTLRAPTRQDPKKTAFYGWGLVSTLQDTAYATVVKEPASYSLRRFLRQSGVWLDGRLGGPRPDAEIQYTWIKEPIEITPTEVTITIREDATWSDGHPITGRDLALRPLEGSLTEYLLPAYAPDTDAEPILPNLAFDDFEIGDRSVTYRSSDGYFEQFVDTGIALWLGPIYPSLSPTHLAPFDTYADAVIETARRAQAGEIYPWYKRSLGDPHKESLIREHLGEAKYVRKFSKPENVLATGTWDLVALDGTDFVFEPNPHHPRVDAINFETVRFEFTRGTQRQRAALKADRFDFSSAGTTPQAVVESFPDHIETIRIPGGLHTGNELAINHDHPALGNRAVRLALMYALDQPTIAENIHPSVAVPVETPGGACWNATDYVSQKWLDGNLATYPQDREKATRLMRDAGYTREGQQWVDGEGEALALTLPTPSDTPTWEPTVASQLNEFGIPTTVQTLDGTVFGTRRDAGEFAIWPSSAATSVSLALHTLFVWENAATNPDKYGIYPSEQFETGEFSTNGTPLPRTQERYRVFTIRAPPIGQPDGPFQEYHPAALNLSLETLSQQEVRHRVKIGMWLANWYLPKVPINKQYVQHFIDAAHWLWPIDTTSWQSFTEGDYRVPKEVLGDLPLRANPDNPEEGASVGET